MKVIGFGDSILKGAVLTDGPSLKYSLLKAGFLEQVCSNDCDFPWAKIGADADYPKEPFTPMDGFLSEYAEMIRLCRERGARPWHERYNLAVFSLGREMDVPVVDITTPFLLRPDYFDFICRDGIHPNEKGHEIMAERLREAECLA